jgi:aromatase
MPHIENSIIIQENTGKVFAITNDIDRWPMLFDEYSGARVTRREEEGRFTKLVFQLSNAEGRSWQSWRLLDHKEFVAIAEREEPLFPFLYMHLKWSYVPVPEGTRMTWMQNFELDPAFETPVEAAVENMQEHTRKNQQRIKRLIEAGEV